MDVYLLVEKHPWVLEHIKLLIAPCGEQLSGAIITYRSRLAGKSVENLFRRERVAEPATSIVSWRLCKKNVDVDAALDHLSDDAKPHSRTEGTALRASREPNAGRVTEASFHFLHPFAINPLCWCFESFDLKSGVFRITWT